LTYQTASVVTNNNAIWIEHRYYLEDESVAEELSRWVISDEEVDDTVHHVRSIRLARVHSARQDHGLPNSNVDRVAKEIGHNKHIDFISAQ